MGLASIDVAGPLVIQSSTGSEQFSAMREAPPGWGQLDSTPESHDVAIET